MRFFLDTEFYERPGSIELISVGIWAEDGRGLYAENALFDWEKVQKLASYGYTQEARKAAETPDWLLHNVRPHLKGATARLYPSEIKQKILQFIPDPDPLGAGPVPKAEFWGYFADYDWVVFCWIFGRMVDLPRHFPMYCRDLKQWADQLGLKRDEFPPQIGVEHNALADARWNKELWEFLAERQMRRDEP